MKRPWTPGPWILNEITDRIGKGHEDGLFFAANFYRGSISLEKFLATMRLAEKAPDMAELLIKLSEWPKNENEFSDLVYDAKQILREIGYDRQELP